ncbi:MAG: M18 family aminopeptidase [Verrucomicrobia bacterium]|nr:M18 family aminopeptidase [Verrucomicrobiota bacterium]
MSSHILEDFRQFLDNSPTSWHAAGEIASRFASVDMTPLDEAEKWQLERGKKYFVERGGSICSFSLPKETPKKITIVCAHTDSPALKLKPRPEVSAENMLLLETEIYGAPILASWMNRDLALAGKVIVQKGKEIRDELVFLEEAPLLIPQIAIHLEKEPVLDKQDHLRPIFTLGGEKAGFLEAYLRRTIDFDTLLSFELMLVPLESSRFLGPTSEMLASYRLDNLASAHACTAAIASAPVTDAIQLALLWDHEEIGSRTAEGAASSFLSDILKRIAIALKLSEEDQIRLKKGSLCVSVDVAHAYNPNFAKKYDPNHQPLMGKGIVLKHNADRKYATDVATAAVITSVCKSMKLPLQSYVSRTDVPCGSTVGPIVAHTLGISTVDIGCGIFSMHSSREVIACQDHLDMCQLLTQILQS